MSNRLLNVIDIKLECALRKQFILIMHSSFVLVFLSSLLILNCKIESKNNEYNIEVPYEVRFEHSAFKINLDSESSFGPECTLSFQEINSEPNLIFNNLANQSIDIYPLKGNGLLKRIQLNDKIRSSIGNFVGSYVMDVNSILVVDRFNLGNSKYLNLSGNIIEDFPSIKNSTGGMNILQNSSNHFQIKDSLFFYSTWPMSTSNKSPNLRDYNYSHCVNLSTGEYIDFDLGYPANYIIDNMDTYAGITTYSTAAKNKMIYSFPQSDSIFIINTDSLNVIKKMINSSQKATPPYTEAENNVKNEKYATAILNAGMQYDPIKNIYYLFRLKEFNSNSNLSKYDICVLKPIEIIILDENFNSIGSIDLPSASFDVFKTFVFNGSLYISQCNLWSEDLNEDELPFMSITIIMD